MLGKTGGRRRGRQRTRWHHRRDGHEFEQTLGDGEGQGSLARCSPWGRKESDTTERLNNKTMYGAFVICRCLQITHGLGGMNKIQRQWNQESRKQQEKRQIGPGTSVQGRWDHLFNSKELSHLT